MQKRIEASRLFSSSYSSIRNLCLEDSGPSLQYRLPVWHWTNCTDFLVFTQISILKYLHWFFFSMCIAALNQYRYTTGSKTVTFKILAYPEARDQTFSSASFHMQLKYASPQLIAVLSKRAWPAGLNAVQKCDKKPSAPQRTCSVRWNTRYKQKQKEVTGNKSPGKSVITTCVVSGLSYQLHD